MVRYELLLDTPSRTNDRLFPLYRYTANHDTDEIAFSLL